MRSVSLFYVVLGSVSCHEEVRPCDEEPWPTLLGGSGLSIPAGPPRNGGVLLHLLEHSSFM